MSNANEKTPQVPQPGDHVHVACHGVVGKIEQSSSDSVVIRKENGGTAIFGSYYFDQILKIDK